MQVLNKLVLTVIASSLGFAAIPAAFAEEAAAPAAAAAPHSEYVKPDMKHAAYGDLKIVVPLTTDDKGIQGMKLRNIANGLKAVSEWKGKMDVTVVLYAKGLTLLKNPDEKVQKQLDALESQGVHFEVCNNSLAEQGVDFHNLYHVKDADIVPSGFVEVAYLQAKKHYVIDTVN
jgi:intracellular sulfur oxidation DsrE/DsrF family protein